MFYLPSEQANTISAYVGGETAPKMNKLGGKDFFQLKERVKTRLHEFAIDLLALYKEREQAVGLKMNRDDYLEQKFENAFEYEETVDQLKAIEDIDNDMMSTKIMDRLVCGDVGFGKTEVAFRACFKAVYNGKQVAFLCPTTILSEQHYLSAKKRMNEFGIRIALLNRFKTPSQVKEIEKKIADGQIDLVIGTQKVLAKTVKFKNLGLLVVDEEQRFGVTDKEKIKDLKKNVDVLAMSATPIPRTLHLSLSGIRDISIIDTPPKDRLPIQTYVAEENDELIENVSKRELARGGKVFIVYNRVMDIYGFASRIRNILPNAKIGVAHGQMSSVELKNTIDRLYHDEYNVFISTTLIENGIDLPLANTMIIIDADKLGLGQMYQLRGRIGRSDKLAYCYLLYRGGKVLTEDAYKRLDAIKEFRQLGSGFKVAMRDLEIRGAGNIFGKEQHGHIEKIGYDMYVKLLDEVVKEIKGEKKKERKDVKLNISLNAYIPEGYIPTSEERIAYYVKISDILNAEEIPSILSSLSQGFGQVPIETENLCYLAYLKNLAGEHNIQSIKINKFDCKIYLEPQEEIVEKEMSYLLDEFDGTLKFEKVPVLVFKTRGNVKNDVLKLINFLEKAKKSL
jgi:transcription-repair coupling factor (superfamily II helicase)